MRSHLVRAAAAIIAIGSFGAAAMTSHFLFVVLGGLALFVLATSFSTASRLSAHLGRLTSTNVEVRVWDVPLPPGSGDERLRLTSVRALGAGLHLYLQTDDGTRPGHLKVAQPAAVVLTPEGVVIGAARYIQWEGKRLQWSEGVPAVIVRRGDV